MNIAKATSPDRSATNPRLESRSKIFLNENLCSFQSYGKRKPCLKAYRSWYSRILSPTWTMVLLRCNENIWNQYTLKHTAKPMSPRKFYHYLYFSEIYFLWNVFRIIFPLISHLSCIIYALNRQSPHGLTNKHQPPV